MNVTVAAQTHSRSVADSLDFLRADLKLPEFLDSKATSEFVSLFDALFDVFNSKNLLGKNFKAPLQSKNEHEWTSLFEEASIYIKLLKKYDGTPILHSRISTGVYSLIYGLIFHKIITIHK